MSQPLPVIFRADNIKMYKTCSGFNILTVIINLVLYQCAFTGIVYEIT